MRPKALFGRAFDSVGLLAALVVPYLVAAAVLHQTLAPQRGYTWARPLRILYGVARGAFFPTASAFVFLLGEASRFETSEVRTWLAKLGHTIDLSPYRRRMVTAGAVAVGALCLGAFNEGYQLVDYFALVLLGAVAGFRRPGKRVLSQAALQLVFVLLLFTAVSYSFSVCKAFLFYFREPDDASIVALEHFIFRGYPHRVVATWASEHPWVVEFSDRIYYFLFHHMALVSIFLIGARAPRERIQFIASLALCYLLGGVSYYLWPALGPGYYDAAAYQFLDRIPLATSAFRRLLFRNTAGFADGAPGPIQTYEYIACMPSLHMAHEFVMLYFARRSRWFFGLSLLFTAWTLLAVVVLGWHYPIDAVAGGGLAAAAIGIAHWQRRRLFPAGIVAGGISVAPAVASVADGRPEDPPLAV